MTEIKSCPRCGLIVEGWSATDGFHPYSHDCELVENDAASEMNGIIREITMEINGDDEPAFLDDAVRRAIANSAAAEHKVIMNSIEDHLERVQQEMVPQSLSKQYEHYGRQQGIREVLSLIQQYDSIKPLIEVHEGERKRYEELINALEDYIDLLKREINEMSGIARAHGWESTRVDEGTRARERIIEARAAFIQSDWEGEKND